MQQEARERQALLLVERQLTVPALRTVERGCKVAEIDPLERGAHGGIVEAAGLGGVAHGAARSVPAADKAAGA